MAVKTHLVEAYGCIRTVHTGRKSELLEIEGINEDMFPPPGRKRKWSPGGARAPGYFCTSLRPGGRWMVTRNKEVIPDEDAAPAREECRRETPPQPITTAHLSQQAIEVAEGWTLLPPRHKAHVMMLITDCVMTLVDSPTLNELHSNACWHDAVRYERYIANRE